MFEDVKNVNAKLIPVCESAINSAGKEINKEIHFLTSLDNGLLFALWTMAKFRCELTGFLSLKTVEHAGRAGSIHRRARAQRRPLSCKERQTAENSLFDHRRRRRRRRLPLPTCLLEIVPERGGRGGGGGRAAGRQAGSASCGGERERGGELDGSQLRISHLFSGWPPSTDRPSAATPPPLLPQTIQRHRQISYTNLQACVQGRGGDRVFFR